MCIWNSSDTRFWMMCNSWVGSDMVHVHEKSSSLLHVDIAWLFCVFTLHLDYYHDTSSEIGIYLAITNFTLQHHLWRKNLINIYLSNTSHTALKRTNACNFHFTCVCEMKGQGSCHGGWGGPESIVTTFELYTKCTHLMYWYTIVG